MNGRARGGREEELGRDSEGTLRQDRPNGTPGALSAGEVLRAEGMPPMERAVAIMRVLRSPEGCPWDREQSFDTIKRHTLEEVYEVFDAIERRSWGELRDELGDLLLQVLFYAQMADEAGYFNADGVAHSLVEKLIRRHPHVFGEEQAADATAVLRNWEQIKRTEKSQRDPEGRTGLFDDVPRSMPAVMEATKLGSQAAKVGFDWPEAAGLLEKMREELVEVEAELAKGPEASGSRAAIEAEMGDVLFTAVNLARHLRVDAEEALRGANAKFRRRFAVMERAAGGRAEMEQLTAAAWDELWCAAKAAETR